MPDTATLQITMPEMGESVTEGIVLEWHVSVGDFVNEGDTVVEVSTDKVDAEVPAPVSGTITALVAEVDDEVPVGQALAEMAPGGEEGTDGAPAAGPATDAPSSSSQAAGEDGASASPTDGTAAPTNGGNGASNGHSNGADVKATPIARRGAEAQGIDLGNVTPTGLGGKVTKEDVLNGGNGSGNGAAAPTFGEEKALRGPAAMLAKAMDESRAVPTATSFRTIAVDTLDAKRKAINAQLKERGLKTSFTHLVAWAIVEATKEIPVMVRTFAEKDGKPFAIENGPVNLGIAVDVTKKDGAHGLMVPAIKGSQDLDFQSFHSAFEDLIAKTRENKLTADDFVGTNISLTNPGGIGTVASVPRLLAGQSAIIATGSIAYPPEWSHASPERIKQLGVSKIMTLTSTYDHRVIQGAESGEFLRRVEQLLQGEDNFYESVAADLGIEAAPITNAPPAAASPLPLSTAAPRAPRAARRRTVRRPRPGRRGTAAGGPGGALAAEGLPHPGPPRRPPQPARRRRQRRPRPGAREPQPDPRADGADPGLDPADRRPGGNAARGAAADARPLLLDDRLPVRAHRLAPAAGLDARDDRDRRPPPAALRRGERAPDAALDRRLPVRALPRQNLPRD